MAVYTQGFAHAQDRLWQMEKTRMLASGKLSQIFGSEAEGIDKFALTIGYRRIAETTLTVFGLSNEHRDLLQAYADGVNDFLEGVGYFHDEITSFYLPLEFKMFGIKKIEPWTLVDSLMLLNLMNFHYSYSWSQDLLREAIDLAGLSSE